MSMTINAANNYAYQTRQISGREKQKDTQPDAGKTQKSSVSASLD